MPAEPYIPYCGLPPLPGGTTWNLDPILVAALLGVAAAYGWGSSRPGSTMPSRAQRLCFAAGWAVLTLALVSPLCSLSVALFSARVAQHMVITLVAAPLLVVGRADHVLLGLLSRRASPSPGFRRSELATGPLLFAVALWIWHSGGPYDATLRSDVVYWIMHLTLIASAILLWRALLSDLGDAPGGGLLASLFTGIQMSVLGALLTFSPRPQFSAHFGTTLPWGYLPIEDQQLGGLIMWVPGGLLLTIHALLIFGLYLHRLGHQHEPARVGSDRLPGAARAAAGP